MAYGVCTSACMQYKLYLDPLCYLHPIAGFLFSALRANQLLVRAGPGTPADTDTDRRLKLKPSLFIGSDVCNIFQLMYARGNELMYLSFRLVAFK